MRGYDGEGKRRRNLEGGGGGEWQKKIGSGGLDHTKNLEGGGGGQWNIIMSSLGGGQILNGIAHRCEGGLKMELDLQSDSHTIDIS